MEKKGTLAPSGHLGIKVTRYNSLGQRILRFRQNLQRKAQQRLMRWLGYGGLIPMCSSLTARHIRNGEVIDKREVLNKVVTTAFCAFVIDQLQAESSEIGDFKFHDSGQGTNAEAAGDAQLQSQTTVARATGTQVENSNAQQYKSVGEITYNANYNITEHGLFSNAGLNTGTCMDRTKFDAIAVQNGDKIEFTYVLGLPSGS